MKFLAKLNTKANNAVIEKENSTNGAVKAYYAGLAAVGAMAAASSPLFALDAIMNKITSTLKKVYTKIVAISTVVAVVIVAICLILRMVSKNQRSVEEATAWIKRVIITWLCLNLLGYFVAYGKELIAGAPAVSW